MLDQIFTDYVTSKLAQLTGRIADCLGRLTQEQIWERGHASENAIGNLVLHLCGNVRQWILSGIAGVPDARDREAEFSARNGPGGGELSAKLAGVVADANTIIAALTEARLEDRVTIQGYDLTVFEAVLHVLEHFSHHAGQIIFATKLATGADLGYYAHLSHAKHTMQTP